MIFFASPLAADHGETYTWRRSGGDSFNKPGSWNPSGRPGDHDTVIFSLDDNGSVTFNNDAHVYRLRLDHGFTHLDLATGSGNEGYRFTAGSLSTDDPAITVGLAAGDVASLRLDAGTLHTPGDMSLGHAGEAHLLQWGATLDIGGTLSLGTLDGGHGSYELRTGELFTAGLVLGQGENSVGELEITSGGTWTNTGDIEIGRAGRGQLTINNRPLTGDTIRLGSLATGDGMLAVVGEGASWTGDQLIVGDAGQGELIVDSNSVFTADEVVIGRQVGSDGLLRLVGVRPHLKATQSLVVGDAGAGTLHAEGTTYLTADHVILGRQSTGYGELHLDSASHWEGSEMIIGQAGHGSLTVGPLGPSVPREFTRLELARDPGSTGELTLETSPATIVTSPELVVARAGEATVNVRDGAILKTEGDAWIGRYEGSDGTVRLTDASTLFYDSGWTVGGHLYVGDDGRGRIIATDSDLRTRTTTIGYGPTHLDSAVTLTGSKTTWVNDQRLVVGEAGQGTLSIGGGALMRVGDSEQHANTYLGRSDDGVGIVDLHGQDSRWLANGRLHIGFEGRGEFTVRDGATGQALVTEIGQAALEQPASTMLIDGEGSTWTTSYLWLTAGHEATITNAGRLETAGYGVLGGGAGTARLTVDQGGAWTGYLPPDAHESEREHLELQVGIRSDAELIVQGGGRVESANALIGFDDEGAPNNVHATVRVEGDGSTWAIDDDYLAIGQRALGEVLIRDGGRLTHQAGGIVTLGYADTGHGIIRVEGQGATWNAEDVPLYLGEQGRGEIHVADGAHVIAGSTWLGYSQDGQGILTIRGQDTLWESGRLYLGSYRSDERTTGELLVADGATLITASANIGIRDTGTATVRGPGTSWSFTLGGPPLTIGSSGEGVLTVEDGAAMDTRALLVGNHAGSHGSLTIRDPGTTWNMTGHVTVGRAGEGAVTLSNGAYIDAGWLYIGEETTGHGTVEVRGEGTHWDGGGNLSVGIAGTGSLIIADGATFTGSSTRIGQTGGEGSVLLTGSGTHWTERVGGSIRLGDGGRGTLEIADGALLESDVTDIATRSADSEGHVHIHGQDSTWKVSQLRLGSSSYDSEASLHIADQGRLEVASSFTIYDGSVHVEGSGSTLAADLLRAYGFGGLRIEGGAQVHTETTELAGLINTQQTASLRGPHTRWTNDGLFRLGYYRRQATLAITDGASLDTQNMTIGSYALGYDDALGALLVDGSDTGLTVHDQLHIAAEGYTDHTGDTTAIARGNLTVRNGATASAHDLHLASVNEHTHGSVTVTGRNTQLTAAGTLTVASHGVGTLTVEDRALVKSARAHLASRPTAAATVDLHDFTTTWHIDQDLNIAGDDAGPGGQATLNIANNATLRVGTDLRLWHQGTLNLGTGNLYADRITLTPGGTLNTTSIGSSIYANTLEGFGDDIDLTGALYLGHSDGHGQHTVTAGQTLATGRAFVVGETSTAELRIEDGGQVTSDIGIIGLYQPAEGNVTMTGPGSDWSINQHLYLGRNGSHGTLHVQDGATVSAEEVRVHGKLHITGQNAQLQARDQLQLSNGMVEVTDGGTLLTHETLFGNDYEASDEALLAGRDARWINTGFLGVGISRHGHGELTIRDHANLQTQSIAVGHHDRDVSTAGGRLLVDNHATLDITSMLSVRNTGTAEFQSGATAQAIGADVAGQLELNDHGTRLDLVWDRDDFPTALRVRGDAASVNLAEGAQLQSDEGYIGDVLDETGHVTLTGQDTAWHLAGPLLRVGGGRRGTLQIADGAQLQHAGRTEVFGFGPDTEGTINIAGEETRWTSAGSVHVGGLVFEGETYIGEGISRFIIRSNATATIDGGVHLYGQGRLEVTTGHLATPFIDLSQGGHVHFNSGTLATGTITGDLNHLGGTLLVGPDAPADHAPTMTITGDLTQTPRSSIQLNFADNHAFGHITIDGHAAIDGTLALNSLDQFAPQYGDEFQVLEALSLAGVFHTVTGMHLHDDLMLGLVYGEDSLTLQALLPGDITGNGFVGGDDLDTLLNHWGQNVAAGATASGDLTGDGFVGGADLDLLLNHWGDQATLGEAYAMIEARLGDTAVPEPTTLALGSLAALLLLLHRPQRRQPRPAVHRLP